MNSLNRGQYNANIMQSVHEILNFLVATLKKWEETGVNHVIVVSFNCVQNIISMCNQQQKFNILHFCAKSLKPSIYIYGMYWLAFSLISRAKYDSYCTEWCDLALVFSIQQNITYFFKWIKGFLMFIIFSLFDSWGQTNDKKNICISHIETIILYLGKLCF